MSGDKVTELLTRLEALEQSWRDQMHDPHEVRTFSPTIQAAAFAVNQTLQRCADELRALRASDTAPKCEHDEKWQLPDGGCLACVELPDPASDTEESPTTTTEPRVE